MMNFYQLPNGNVAGFDTQDEVPEGAVEITGEQFAQIATSTVLTLAQAQASQVSALTAACKAAITSGFSSSALGSTYTYPSTMTDQANQAAVATCVTGGLLWCESSSGVWALVQHTQAQAQGVITSFATWLNACQQQLVTLTASVNAASTVAAAQAIEWSTP